MLRIDTTAYATVAKGDFRRERRDCSVRAFAVAMGVPYEEAHAAFKRHGRKDHMGTPVFVSHWVHTEAGMTRIDPRMPTLTQFIRENPKGRFVVHRRGHAFAVIDGVVHDWGHGTGARTRVQRAWRAPTNGIALKF